MLNSTSSVLLLDPNGNISTENGEVYSRHMAYAEELNKISGVKFIIFSGSSEKQATDADSWKFRHVYIMKRTRNSAKFAFVAFKEIRRTALNPVLLVAGDPWESGIAAIILRYLLRTRIPIQMQIHADVASFQWRQMTPINSFRYQLSKFTVRFAFQIRTVSQLQAESLRKNFNLPNLDIVCIPVPLNLPAVRPNQFRQNSVLSFGLVGRIHKDRGIDQFCKCISLLSPLSEKFQVLIVGDGPHKSLLTKKMLDILPPERIKFLGILNSTELSNTWSNISILFSMAQSESYGRAIREAIYHGVGVICFETSGTSALANEAPNGSFRIISPSLSGEELNSAVNEVMNFRQNSSYCDYLERQNLQLKKEIAMTWLNIIKRAEIA